MALRTDSDTLTENTISEGEDTILEGEDTISEDSADEFMECKHYDRNCEIIAPCCGNFFTCRQCHDEYYEDEHKIDRFKIKEVMCKNCNNIQLVDENCSNCGIIFGKYFCRICNLFDNTDKKQFHCKDCGICRVGGKDNYFHCDKCNICILIIEKNTHKCMNIIDYNCPICLEDLHKSTKAIVTLRCGHYIHNSCFMELLKNDYKCPLCLRSVVDLSSYNEAIDREKSMIEIDNMPEEFKDKDIKIHCNDCSKGSDVLFHIMGNKCEECGSYNTRII